MVEAAWIAIRYDQKWKAQFDRLAHRIGRKKAIVAIARKLLVVVWHTLSKKRVDRQADPIRVTKYFLAWARQAQSFKRLDLKAPAFARKQLDLLGIGHPAIWQSGLFHEQIEHNNNSSLFQAPVPGSTCACSAAQLTHNRAPGSTVRSSRSRC